MKPVPALQAMLLATHLVGIVAIFLMGLSLLATVLLVLLVFVSAVRTLRAQAEKRGLSFVLAADGALRVCRDDGHDSWGSVLPGAVLFPGVSWFTVSSMEGRRLRRLSLMLIPGEVIQRQGDNTQWRQLRTWLRHRSVKPLSDDDLSGL